MVEKEYTLGEVLLILRRYWIALILVPVVVAIAAVFGVKQAESKNVFFESQTQLLVAPNVELKGSDEEKEIARGLLDSEKNYANSYMVTLKDIVKSDELLATVIGEMNNLDKESPEVRNSLVPNLRERISIEQTNGSLMFTLSATDNSAKKAAELANAVAKELLKEGKQYWGVSGIEVMSEAIPATGAAGQTPKSRVALIGVFVGLILVIVFALVRENAKRNKQD